MVRGKILKNRDVFTAGGLFKKKKYEGNALRHFKENRF